MQLGKALVGAIIGAALGIGLLLAVHFFFAIDKAWLSIPVALLTGLGVRMLVSTSGHASYIRGALTGILALAAYLGGMQLVAQVATWRAANAPKPQVPAIEPLEQPGDESTETEPVTEPAPVQAAPVASRRPDEGMQRHAGARDFSTWDFIWLSVAALVAYELGRGTGASTAPVVQSESTPGRTHPDA